MKPNLCITRRAILQALTLLAVGLSTNAAADLLPVYGGPSIDKTSAACASFGDAVSCSAPMLNYLNGLPVGQKTTDSTPGYVLTTPQGTLQNYIVVTSGGGTQANNDVGPSPYVVENGFKSNDAGADKFLATGLANGTTVVAGNLNDPTNNSLTLGDNPGTWDAGTTWLKDALTINGQRHELMIGFDYNQQQSSTTSLSYWALITVRDINGGMTDINYEIRAFDPTKNYSTFSTSKTFASMPSSTDFSDVSGTICVYQTGSVAFTGGNCPNTDTLFGNLVQQIDNAQSTSTTEFLAFLPELNDNLDTYVGQGYDTISVRLLMGCYGAGATNQNKIGSGYLSDEASGGTTSGCDNGGYGDVFLLAGDVMDTQVPEPSSLLLLGLALLALARMRRTRRFVRN